MPVSSATVNSQNLVGVMPHSLLDSKEGIDKSNESKVVMMQSHVASAQDGGTSVNLNNVDRESRLQMCEDMEKVTRDENKSSLSNNSIYGSSKMSQDSPVASVSSRNMEELDDSDMSLGAQLLLNLSNQNVHPPVMKPVSNPPQTTTTATGMEKPCMGGNSQFPFRNFIFQVSQPIKTEPPDDWSESTDVNNLGSFVSVKQEKPDMGHDMTVPACVPVSQLDVLPTEPRTRDTTSLSNRTAVMDIGGQLLRVSNSSLPQPVSQIIEEHVLANRNLPHVQLKTVSKKNGDLSTVRGVGNRRKHSYCQTNYDDSADEACHDTAEKDPSLYNIDWEKAKKAIEAEKLRAALRSSPTQMKSKHLSLHSKKPIRPVDRQKMGPWLKNLLDNETCPGLVWVDRSHKVFQVSWRHRARMGWDMKLDGDVFERWARHTGIYCDGDPPEPRRWKTNFRAALHSMSDVEELPGIRKGRYAYRRYYFRDFDESDASGEPSGKKSKKEDKSKLASPVADADHDVTPDFTPAAFGSRHKKSTEQPGDTNPGDTDTSLTGADSMKDESSDVESTSSVELAPDILDRSQNPKLPSFCESNMYIPSAVTVRSFNIPSQEILGNAHTVAPSTTPAEPHSTPTSSVLSAISHPSVASTPSSASPRSAASHTSVVSNSSIVPTTSFLLAPVLPVSSGGSTCAGDVNPTPIRIIHTSVAPIQIPISMGLVPSSMVTIPTSLGHIPSVVPSLSAARSEQSVARSRPSVVRSELSVVRSEPSAAKPNSASASASASSSSSPSVASSSKDTESKHRKTVRLVAGKRKRKKSEDAGPEEVKPFCTFCEKLVRNLSTHLDRKHRKETAVAEALSFLSYLRSKSTATKHVGKISDECHSKQAE
ncbi:uncharacterized protein LOC121368323 [Gigantopelta aegis]|uniref:uncharacterized protein LOC121368323 n=1 Tax=Gigantopelta aegis TaxID=1735272 RepID=UPI001B88AEB1|nr:uncharacterized protein LOC121368323 [Gigantopelta aegis]